MCCEWIIWVVGFVGLMVINGMVSSYIILICDRLIRFVEIVVVDLWLIGYVVWI